MAEHTVPIRDDYPNQSDRKREEPKKVKVEKVTTGKVVQKKKSFGRRFAEAFGAREGQGVIDYILYDIIIPATKNMIVDSIIDGAEMAILGEVRGRRRGYNDYRGGSGRATYRYDRVSYRQDDRDYRDRRNDDRDYRDRRGLRDYEDIVFDTQRDAEDVISGLVDMIDSYGQATVGDLYDLAGLTPEYTVGNFGWRNLSSATVKRGRDGYFLDLPRAVVL